MNTLKNLLRKGITIGSFCLVSGTILSAQISLSMQNKSTREVIREIEKVSDYRFFYNDNLSGLNTKISVSAQGENIRDVLEQIKSQAQITYIIKENNQIVLFAPGYVSSSTQQNTRKITGIIKDQSGEPVIGANIVEKGTTNGTFKFVIFQLQKYIYFLNLQFFPQRFFFFYILSYQLDSLTCTKNHLFITNHLNPPPK